MSKTKGKTIVVFGGTGGIGEAVVTTFHNSGANMVVVGRNLDKLAKLRYKFGDTTSVLALSADVADPAATDSVFFSIKEKFDGVDGVFISVGSWEQNYTNTPEAELKASRERLKKSLVDTVMNICRSAVKAFGREGGVIFHVSSHVVMKGEDVLPGNVIYREKKKEAETVLLSFANRHKGVQVVNLRPAIVNTLGNKELLTKGGVDRRDAAVQPEEIANWCVKHFGDLFLPSYKLFGSDVVV